MVTILIIPLVSCGMLAVLGEAAADAQISHRPQVLDRFGSRGIPGLADLTTADDHQKRRWYNSFFDFLEDLGVQSDMSGDDFNNYRSRWEEFKADYAEHMNADAAKIAAEIIAERLPNNDRIQCLRFDNLDLVVPPKEEYMMRLATGSDEHTGSDVYVTVDNFWLKRLNLAVKLKRASTEYVIGEAEHLGHAFDIEISGVSEPGKESLASLEFEVTGLKPYIASKLMAAGFNFAANWFTNREVLEERQEGSCQFKLTARAVGVVDQSTGMWGFDLLQKRIEPFVLEMDNQHMINKISQLFRGTIQEAVSSVIWEQLYLILPRSFAALTSKLEPADLSFELGAHINGGQEKSDSPLALEVGIDSTVNANPAKMLALLKETFDVKTMAERYFKALVEETNLEYMWKQSKQVVANMVSRYGVSAEWVMNEFSFDQDKLKQQLLDAVAQGADAIVKGLTPFIKARERGFDDPFAGVAGAFGAQIDWNAEDVVLRGRKRVALSSAVPGAAGESTDLLRLPTNFINAIAGGEVGMVVSPKVGQDSSVLELTALDFARSELSWSSLKFTNLRLSSKSDMLTIEDGQEKNVSTTQIWKTTGSVEDMKMIFPADWDPHWSAELLDWKCEIHPGGLVTLDLGTGVRMTENEMPTASATADVQNSGPSPMATRRTGSEDEISGPVPERYEKPTLELEKIGQLEIAPKVQADIGFKVSTTEHRDGASHIVVKATGTLTANVNLNRIVKPLMASRPTEDTGYIFFAAPADLQLWYQHGEARPPNFIGYKKVVLNCGYLRIFDEAYLGKEGSFDAVTFSRNEEVWVAVNSPQAKAQIEIDLSVAELQSPRVVSVANVSEGCLELMHRTSGWITKQKDTLFLCGAPPSVPPSLADALALQVKRFQNDTAKSKRLNFGTHERYDEAGTPKPQHSLPDGFVTEPLLNILRRDA